MKKGFVVMFVVLSALIITGPAVALAQCTAPLFQPDGRINAWHQCAPIAAYPDGAGGLIITWVEGNDYHMGDLAFHLLADQVVVAMAMELEPVEQVLIAEGNGIDIYLTWDGIIKVEIPGDYGFEFDGGLLLAPPPEWGTEIWPDAYGNRGFT